MTRSIPKDQRRKQRPTKFSGLNGILFQTPEAQRAAMRKQQYRGEYLFPGILSTDRSYVNFKFELFRAFNRHFPVDIREDGFAGPSGVVADGSALLSTTGVGMDPMTCPPRSNVELIAKKGIANSFQSTEDERVFSALWDEMFTTYKPAPMKFARESSTVFPFFQKGVDFKNDMIDYLFSKQEVILNAVASGDLQELARHGAFFAYFLVKRDQPDGVMVRQDPTAPIMPKAREVVDLEFARSSGARGRVLESNKLIHLEALGLDKAVAMRRRTAFGHAAMLNYYVSMFLAGRRSHYLHEFGETWHHPGTSVFYDRMTKATEVMGFDVSQMDQNVPPFLIDFFVNRFEQVFDKRVVDIMRLQSRAPYYAPSLGTGMDPYWMGNPLNLDSFDVRVGLPSGVAWNPDFGKWYMVGCYAVALQKATGKIIDPEDPSRDRYNIARFLRGENEYFGLLDMSDDAVLLTYEKGMPFLPGLKEKIKTEPTQISPYALLAVENGIAFLGMIPYKDATGTLREPVPNIVNYMVNMFAPERGIHSHFRRYWGFGLLDRRGIYSRAHNTFVEVDELINDIWRIHLNEYDTPEVAARKHANAHRPKVVGKTAIDQEVLLDPDKLYYKYSTDEVSEDIANMFVRSVPAERIHSELKQYMH